ncbi:hypothetical protein [Paenibacillus typhae]|uniref:hypothetical protein n=1 Tax=Paenibacillus typhae TaxID=1174501 RepID=UPI001C8D81AB|nr:hypothetical protein [Paenibacillus typhae]MBY0010768.1 hypothetical protein [Paenibacillus typhae]
MIKDSRSRFVSLFAIMILTLFTAACTGKVDKNDASDNPIDRAFSKDFENASSTTEDRYVSHAYVDAWEAEWNHLIEDLIKHYQFEEDKNILREYKKRYEAFVEQGSELEWINWSDTSEAPSERTSGTGAFGGFMREEANLYRNQVLYLIDKYYSDSDMNEYGEYTYLYSGNGAEFDKALE